MGNPHFYTGLDPTHGEPGSWAGKDERMEIDTPAPGHAEALAFAAKYKAAMGKRAISKQCEWMPWFWSDLLGALTLVVNFPHNLRYFPTERAADIALGEALLACLAAVEPIQAPERWRTRQLDTGELRFYPTREAATLDSLAINRASDDHPAFHLHRVCGHGGLIYEGRLWRAFGQGFDPVDPWRKDKG